MAEPAPVTTGRASSSWRGLAQRHEERIALALLFLITIPMLTKIFTSDFGTHLALGRQILQDLHVADKEFLNYPSLGLDQPNPVWLFQAVLYGIFSVGGVYAVSLLVWAVVFAVFLLLYRSMVLRGANRYMAVLALFAFSGFLRIRIQPRPEIFTYLFIAASIYLFSEFFYGTRKRWIYLFPALVLVWANSHPTYLMAFLLCGIFTVDFLARAAWNRELAWQTIKPGLLPPVIVGGIGMIVCGLNPQGYESVLAPLQTITRGAVVGGASTVMMSISELTPVRGTGMFVYYQSAAAFAAVSLLLGLIGRRLYLLDLLLFTVAFKGAWDSARAVSMMGLFLSPGASLHLTGFLERMGERLSPAASRKEMPESGKEKGKRKGKGKGKGKAGREKTEAPDTGPVRSRAFPARKVTGGLIVAVLLLFGGATLSFSMTQLEYGVGITEHKFSFAAAEFLRNNPIPGKMFNFFDIGGFLDWQLYPEALTFLDGRTYNQKIFMEHQTVTGAMPGWQGILDRHGVTYIVTKAIDSSGIVLPIISSLANDREWSLVFADGLFLIFVKKLPETRDYLQAHTIQKGSLYRHIIWESYHYMYLGVSPAVAYQNIANMYLAMGDRQQAIATLRKAAEETGDPFLRQRLMQLEQGRDNRPFGHP